MALKSFRITKKELETFYSPKTSDYDLMVNSITSNGYGQIIEQYVGNEVLNTYYHIWDTKGGQMVIYNKISDSSVIESEAGPIIFGVSSDKGISFLNGTSSISGFRKLKYCNGCSDGNGLDKPVIDNFKKRFTQVKELVFGYDLLEGFLFYDETLPKYQDVFPAVKVDDGVNVTYQFKSVDGTDLTPQNVSTITGKPVSEIESSVDTSSTIKPQEGNNTVIVSCCDKQTYHIIPNQTAIGSVVYIDSIPESYCWYAESYTNDSPTIYPSDPQKGPRSCEECVKIYGCPSSCEQIEFVFSTDPTAICSDPRYRLYDVNWADSKIFFENDCNGSSPENGYYYDGKNIYYWDGEIFREYGTCGSSPISSEVVPCCGGKTSIIDGVYSVGTVLYTNDTDPATCFEVIGNSTESPTISLNFKEWGGDCGSCTKTYPGGCK